MKEKAGVRHQESEGCGRRGPARHAPRRLCASVAALPPELGKLVETMLVEGATFEDVVEAVDERGQARVTLHAVQNFFRSNLELQQRRIKRQKETAQALRKALGDPKSGEQEMADAILMTGLMRVNRRGSEFGAKDAVYDKYERENIRLKQKQTRLREQKLRLDTRVAHTRLEFVRANTRLAAARLLELQRMLETRNGRHQLGPEAFQKIQEIYGLIGDQNPAPAQA